MQLFTSEKLNSMEDLLRSELEDLYDAEKRLVQALPKMANSANSPQLQQAFQEHYNQTEGHVQRLEECFRQLNWESERETCQAMKSLISEGEEAIQAEGDPDVRDAALIAAAQRVEHYEMAGYGSARTFARRMGRQDVADVLQQTLDEEGEADMKLTELAEQSINPQAEA
jgi:ferritin-like metal-binding protein YciE